MSCPKKVNIIEVGPRDGFQNISEPIATEDKLAVIDLLVQAGVSEMEVTSFVSPKAIPQMADAAQVAEYAVSKYADVLHPVALVPNQRGAENALKAGVKSVAYVISVSEHHNKANVNKTVEESIQQLTTLIQAFPELNVRLDAATAFGCPYEGDIAPSRVLALLQAAVNAGCRSIMLCDTIGVATPVQVQKLMDLVLSDDLIRKNNVSVGLHLHDTRGQGLANILAAMEMGISTFETSVGGLGGCPFAPGAAGNTATEDLLYMLNGMGIETGIDLNKYLQAVEYVKTHIRPNLTGHLGSACAYHPEGN